MWDVKAEISADIVLAIVAHLERHCDFEFSHDDYRVTAERLGFYGDALLCQLDLPAGCTLKTRRRRPQELPIPTRFYFLYKCANGIEVLLPLSGREGDLIIAKRWFGLTLDSDPLRLAYARFYLAYGQTKKPPRYFNVPRSVHDLRLNRITDRRIWGIYGSLWRFGVGDQELAVRPHFERRGTLWFSRWRAHVPIQKGNELHDVDLSIWDIDGHVTFHPSSIIYRDPALLEMPQSLPAQIDRPDYIRWHERLLALYRNSQAIINQIAYLMIFVLFIIAAAVSVFLPLEIYGYRFAREALVTLAAASGIGTWTDWLKVACFYCIAYFAFTTVLILDAGTVRNSLLTMNSRFKDSWLDGFLFRLERRERRIEYGYRRGLLRRIRIATQRLIAWTFYMVCLFTSLQVSYRPQLVDDAKALGDIWQVFAEQALLYAPVVFYWVGRKSLDPQKMMLVTPWILVLLQLWMGLLVVRRIHRYWASTSSARLNEQVVERSTSVGTARAA